MINQATVHTTSCGRYVVEIPRVKGRRINATCRSMREARDILRRHRVTSAQLAQRIAFDEMVGQPTDETVSFMPLTLTD